MRSQMMAEDGPNPNSQSTLPIAQIDPVPRVSIQAFCESPEAVLLHANQPSLVFESQIASDNSGYQAQEAGTVRARALSNQRYCWSSFGCNREGARRTWLRVRRRTSL